MKIVKKGILFALSLLMVFSSVTTVFGEEEEAYSYSFNVSDYASSVTWDGSEKEVSPTVTLSVTQNVEETEEMPIASDGTVLSEGTDYTISYTNNKNPGTASFKIVGIGSYEGIESDSYTFKITTASLTVKTSKITNTSFKMTFSGVSNIAKYEVTVNGSTYTTTNNYYTISNLTKATTYSISVIGYDSSDNLVANGSGSVTTKATTSITTSSISQTSFKYKFSAISDSSITKYIAKVTDSSGNSVYSKTVSANTTYTVSSLTKNTSYTLTITAYTSDANYTAASTTVKTLPTVAKVTIKSTKAGNEMAKITWEKASGATGYKVYRSTSKNGTYKLVKTTTSTSYTNYLLTKNKKYYYKVRAYKTVNGKKVYGKYSSVVSVKPKASTKNTYYLRVNIKTNNTVVYAKNFSGKWVAVKAFATSAGLNGASKAILGTHYTIAKYRWKYMHANCYTQYATRIVGHYLFHSVPYSKKKASTLWQSAYNKLGSFASAGCIRMDVKSSKWIYDHCPLKTKVKVVYSSTDDKKKPTPVKNYATGVKAGWDPTDPSSKNPWNN